MAKLIPPASIATHTISQVLARNAEVKGDSVWLVSPDTGTTITWQAAHTQAQTIAATLQSHGMKAGDTIALATPNSTGACLAWLGIVIAGGRALPINLVAGKKVMEYVLAHSETRLALVSDEAGEDITTAIDNTIKPITRLPLHADKGLADDDDNNKAKITVENFTPPTITPSHEALLMYTSGTTGMPKGVLHSHGSLLAAGRNVMVAHNLTSTDRGLCVLPIYHINGLCVTVLGSLVSASSLVMPPKFSLTQFWQQLYDHACSWFSAVPTHFAYILNDDRTPPLDPKRLRFARSASAPLPPETHRKFEARFGIPIIETMGLTETGAQILSNPMPPKPRKIGSPGIAYGNEVRIADPNTLATLGEGEEGEILIRGDNVMLGYLKQAEETAKTITADGWLRSGDLGRMDDEGFVFVTGRIKELIIKGGENITPREVDEALLTHVAVLEAAAFGRPCDMYGQRVEACVKLKADAAASPPELIAHCQSMLGQFKSPEAIHILDELPKGPSGKVQRLKLIDLVG